MSRHRNVRNLNLDDYLDDGFDDDDYDDDYEDDDYDASHYQYQPRNNASNFDQFLPPGHQDHSQNQSAPEQNDNLDDDLLDDMVEQFRTVLNDRTLSSMQVSRALQDADYDWEIALATLRSLQITQAEEAAPSPIARLLTDDDLNNDNVSRNTPLARLPSVSVSTANEEGTDVPDYDTFVAHSGTALVSDASSTTEPPFQFDHPSPDDVIRAKQARGAARANPSLRLPRPAGSSRTVGPSNNVKPSTAPNASAKNGDGSTEDELSIKNGSKKPVLPKKPLKPLKPPRPARAPPRNTANVSSSAPSSSVVKQRAKKVNTEDRISNDSPSISVVVAGHVDAGKSTLVGHLLQQASGKPLTTSTVTTRRRSAAVANLAWDTDEDHVERERGVTIDIASRCLQRPGPPPRTIALIDAPGHRDFVPAMIVGASQATAALLVVDASEGEFEAGFSDDGQAREHAIVLKSFGISRLIVVVNKMDMADYSQARFNAIRKSVLDFLRLNGWKPAQVSFIPTAGREGINLAHGPAVSHPLAKWYHESTLLHALDSCPVPTPTAIRQALKQPTRLVVSDLFRSATLGGQLAVSGRLISGSIATKDRLVCVPGHDVVSIKVVTNVPNRGVGAPSTSKNTSFTARGATNGSAVAIASLDAIPISLALTDLPDTAAADSPIITGSVLCDPEHVCPAARRVRAMVLVTGKDALIIRGTRGVLHVGATAQEAYVVTLREYVNGGGNGGGNGTGKKSKNGDKSKAKQTAKKKGMIRKLVKGDSAIVEIASDRPIALETAEKCKELSRFALRQSGRTILVGVVQEVLGTEKSEVKDETDKELSTFRRL